MAAHRAWRQEVAWATYTDHVDLDPKDAETAAKRSVSKAKLVRFPTYMDTTKTFCADPDSHWHSLTGERAGRPAGYPRFHAKSRSRDSFTLFHDVKKPTLRPDEYRWLVLPKKITGKRGGSIRLHGNLRKLARRIAKGTARIQSVTISRGGKHWYASILAEETIEIPTLPPAPRRRPVRPGST